MGGVGGQVDPLRPDGVGRSGPQTGSAPPLIGFSTLLGMGRRPQDLPGPQLPGPSSLSQHRVSSLQ